MKHNISFDAAALPPHFIEWGRAPAVEHTTWLGEGDFCACYLVNYTYVFRFAKHAEASAAMAVERCILPLLVNYLTVAVPQVEFVGRRADTGLGMMGYPVVPGEPLEPTVLDSLPLAGQVTLISQMAHFARQLHELPLDLISHCGVHNLHPLTHIANIMERARTTVWPLLTEPVCQYYEYLWNRYKGDATLHTYRPALLHGDLSLDHFLFDASEMRLTGVIDFGDTCIGDPAWDLVYLYEDYGPNMLDTFLARYAPRNVERLKQKVCIYQQLNNVEYCFRMLQSADERQIREAIAVLEEQATARCIHGQART